MNASDRINKAAFDLMSGMKDTVAAAITNAVVSGDLQIDKEQLQPILTLVSGTIEGMYHKGIRVFMRSVDASLAEVNPEKK